jgi:hypothetical protein
MRGGRMVVEGPIAETLHGEAVLEIVARPMELALQILARFGDAARDGSVATLTVRNGGAAEVARALVEAGVAVDSMAPRKSSLESLVVGGSPSS